MPDKIFKYIRQTRTVFTEWIDGLSLEEINAVPNGFRNNIGWNFGHIVVSTQGLCYRRTGIQPDRYIAFVDNYGKGTAPQQWINAEELQLLKAQALTTIDELEADYRKGMFSAIDAFATSTYKLGMETIEEVLTASLAHDNLHFGYAMSIRRALEGNKNE